MNESKLLENVVNTQRNLATLIGVSGHENEVRNYIFNKLKQNVDEIWIDKMGNVLGIKKGTDPNGLRIMIDAHMDEVGLIISYIEQNGFLRFSPLGGIDKRLYPGSDIKVQTKNGKLVSGIIGMNPPHITDPKLRDKTPDFLDLFIDIGAKNEEEVKLMGIMVGSRAVLDGRFEYNPDIGGGFMRGRGFDDRTGCNVALQVSKLIKDMEPIPNTILYSFTVCEEVGGRGVPAATDGLNPDIGIALENTIAADVPGVPLNKQITRLDHGPAFSVADRGTIYHEKLLEIFKLRAEELGFEWQYKTPAFGGTNAGIFHKMHKGIPSGCISVPSRYIHSPIAMIRISDVIATIKTLFAILTKPIEI
jgi:endoglucanase